MTALRFCPDCETELPADAPEGLCPRCLLHSGLLSPNRSYSSPGNGIFHAPGVEEISAQFPHLEILEMLGQ